MPSVSTKRPVRINQLIGGTMSWNDEKIGQLKRLWKDGLTTSEIGKKLGISKNAVVGKAHRLSLEGRPSPIRTVAMPVAAGKSAHASRAAVAPSVKKTISVVGSKKKLQRRGK